MKEQDQPHGWWQTLPGMLTATAAIITALAGLIAALSQLWPFRAVERRPSNTPSPITDSRPSGSVSPGNLEHHQNGAEVKINRFTYKVVATQLDSHKKDKPTVRFTIRMTNNKDLTGANFLDSNCRLVVDGVARAPISGLNEIVDAHSSMDADFVFLIPTGTKSAALEFWDRGESETIPIDIPSE